MARDGDFERLDKLQDKLMDVFSYESDPDYWPGTFIQIDPSTGEKRIVHQLESEMDNETSKKRTDAKMHAIKTGGVMEKLMNIKAKCAVRRNWKVTEFERKVHRDIADLEIETDEKLVMFRRKFGTK